MNKWLMRDHHWAIDGPLIAGLFVVIFAFLLCVLLVGCVCTVGRVVWEGWRDE